MTEKIKQPSVEYSRDRTTLIAAKNEDGEMDSITNREFSMYILDSICGGGEFARGQEDIDWLHQMFDGFEDHIAELQAKIRTLDGMVRR